MDVKSCSPNMCRAFAAVIAVCALGVAGFAHEPQFPMPAASDRPETWFHLIGGNVSREGLTADLEAIHKAGISGIHLFHGQLGKAWNWPGVTNPIPCLSKDWDGMVAHVGAECKRLGLTFKMQNCPGWSMSGGPWITPEKAMRNLCYSRTAMRRGTSAILPRPLQATDSPARDYRDICVIAFPTPEGDTGKWLVPDEMQEPSAQERIFRFEKPVTVRTLELPSNSEMDHDRSYEMDTRVTFEAEVQPGVWRKVVDEDLPMGNYSDRDRMSGVRQTLACDEVEACSWRLNLHSKDPLRLGEVRLGSGARLEHWEGLAGWTLRGLVNRGTPRQNPASWVNRQAITNLTGCLSADGTLDWVPPDDREWTVLRVGHVNALFKNGPAPEEATGFECSKLSPKGIEANYAAYIGRLVKEPLKGLLAGIVVDSWECYRDNWTEGLDAIFAQRCGYGLERWLPAVFGWVVGTPNETEAFLRDWRGLLGKLIEENYYGHLAELAHKDGLTVQYETAFGDVLAGDLLEFWKYADTPMCEFWCPTAPTGVGSANFKPVLPCVSAAHIYGKRRVAAEAFTSFVLTWNESLRDFKPMLDRHLAKGVTYPVFHTYTHNPQVGAAFRPPGTAFGCGIGSPFLRGQPWWPFMPRFTDYIARCTAFLESGYPVVDILRVLGDGLGHKPDERVPHFGNRFKDDYVNRDVLLNRLTVQNGRLVLPDGMSYTVLWVPKGTFLDTASQSRIASLKAAGARVVEGDDPTAGLMPDVVRVGETTASTNALAWYHRQTQEEDRYFIAAPDGAVSGVFAFRGREVALELEANESRFVCFSRKDGACTMVNPVTGCAPCPRVAATARTLEGFAAGTSKAHFSFSAKAGERLVLDLGKVEQCAEVSLNGATAAQLWCEPYRVDLTPFIKEGENVLEVSVTASIYNRLVREATLPEAQRTTWTICGPKAGSPILPAGLYGPVRLLSSKTVAPK